MSTPGSFSWLKQAQRWNLTYRRLDDRAPADMHAPHYLSRRRCCPQRSTHGGEEKDGSCKGQKSLHVSCLLLSWCDGASARRHLLTATSCALQLGQALGCWRRLVMPARTSCGIAICSTCNVMELEWRAIVKARRRLDGLAEKRYTKGRLLQLQSHILHVMLRQEVFPSIRTTCG